MADHKFIYSIIFLPIILFIGCITSYEDLKTSKIRNKWVILGIAYAAAIYSLSGILYILAAKNIVSSSVGYVVSYLVWNFDRWCINFIISVIVAYFLWHFKMWGAGDAKLFICYAGLIPMAQYSKVYFEYYFASFLLLLAIFIPVTAFLFLRAIIYFFGKVDFREMLSVKRIIRVNNIDKTKVSKALKVFLGLMVLFLSLKILRQALENSFGIAFSRQGFLLFILLLAFNRLSAFFKKNTRFVIFALIGLLAYFGFKVSQGWQNALSEIGGVFVNSLSFTALFYVAKKMINFYSEAAVKKTISFAHWMFIGAVITWFYIV